MWAASGTDDDRRYALRLVDGAKLLPEERDKLERAAVTIAGVEHAGIVAIRAVASDRDGLTIASDAIEALSLTQVLTKCRERGEPLNVEACVQIALDMLAAVAFMHIRAPTIYKASGGFGYGGLTPDSFAVCSDGRTRMLEMSLPSVLRRFRMLAQEPQRIGYDAAEVLQVGIDVDATADVFSIGAMLWEMLRNQRLFPGTGFHVISKLRAGPLPRIDHDGSRVLPAMLADIVATSLERSAEDRFASAGEMAAQLRDVNVACSTEAVRRVVKVSGIRSRPEPPVESRRRGHVPAALAGARPPSDKAPKSRRTIPREQRSVPPRSDRAPRPLDPIPEEPTPMEHTHTRAKPALEEVVSELPTKTPPTPSSSAIRERIPEVAEAGRASHPPVSSSAPERRRGGAARLAIAAALGAVIAVVVTLVVTSRDAETTSAPTAPDPPPSVRVPDLAPVPPPPAKPSAIAEPEKSAAPEPSQDAGTRHAPVRRPPKPAPGSDRLPDDI